MATLSATQRALNPSVSDVCPGLCIRIPRNAYTFDGFREWVQSDELPEKLHVAFIDQEIFLDMSKEELETHAMVKAEISRVLMNLIRALMLGRFYLDGVLLTNRLAKVSNNPDALFVSWSTLEKGRGRLVPREGEQRQYLEIEGTPDWVLEVVSDSSVRKDTEYLRIAYHRAGIPEYWLVDARGSEIVFQILYRRKTGYAAARVVDGWQRSRVFGRSFRLVRTAVRLGLWEYTLEVEPE